MHRRTIHRPPGGRRHSHPRSTRGLTLVEVTVTMAIAGILLAALGSTVMNALSVREDTQRENALTREARFAMDRMLRFTGRSRRLLAPLHEDPNTGRSESIVEPGFIALTLDPELDRDLDGFADADNDRDGRVDEDLPGDSTNDGRPGVRGIDDDNSGITDISISGAQDDDETGFLRDEDPINGIDDDGDGTIDEDPPSDMNGDGAPGIASFDDDGDGLVDEGDVSDDDEDGQTDEDWYDVVAYRLDSGRLMERLPNLSPADGQDYTERVIAADVETFRVEFLPLGTKRSELLDITLVLAREGERISLRQRVRIGGRLQ